MPVWLPLALMAGFSLALLAIYRLERVFISGEDLEWGERLRHGSRPTGSGLSQRDPREAPPPAVDSERRRDGAP